MRINRLNLIGSLNKVLPGIATGTVKLEGADTIIFNDGHIYSYNSAISVDVKSPDDINLKGVIKGQDFYNCLNKLPSDEIDIEITESSWNITDNNIKVSIKLLPQNDLLKRFEGLKPTENWFDIDGNDFNNSLKVCTIKGNSSSFGGIYYEDGECWSTNKWCINKYILKNKYPKFWISDGAVTELLKWDNFTKVQFNKSWVQFLSDDGAVFSVRTLDIGKYPLSSIKPLLENECLKTSAIELHLIPSFYEAINRAAEFSHTIDERETICIEFNPDKSVKVKGSRLSGDYEEVVPEMSVEVPSVKELNFDFNDFISSEKFFDKLKIISDDKDFNAEEPIHVILESDTAIKLFSSMI